MVFTKIFSVLCLTLTTNLAKAQDDDCSLLRYGVAPAAIPELVQSGWATMEDCLQQAGDLNILAKSSYFSCTEISTANQCSRLNYVVAPAKLSTEVQSSWATKENCLDQAGKLNKIAKSSYFTCREKSKTLNYLPVTRETFLVKGRINTKKNGVLAQVRCLKINDDKILVWDTCPIFPYYDDANYIFTSSIDNDGYFYLTQNGHKLGAKILEIAGKERSVYGLNDDNASQFTLNLGGQVFNGMLTEYLMGSGRNSYLRCIGVNQLENGLNTEINATHNYSYHNGETIGEEFCTKLMFEKIELELN